MLAVTGGLAFVHPFSIHVVGLHSLIGFVFIALIALPILNNGRYFPRGPVWITLSIVSAAAGENYSVSEFIEALIGSEPFHRK